MNNIKISLQEVQNCQKQIENLNERIYGLLIDMKNQMNRIIVLQTLPRVNVKSESAAMISGNRLQIP